MLTHLPHVKVQAVDAAIVNFILNNKHHKIMNKIVTLEIIGKKKLFSLPKNTISYEIERCILFSLVLNRSSG